MYTTSPVSDKATDQQQLALLKPSVAPSASASPLLSFFSLPFFCLLHVTARGARWLASARRARTERVCGSAFFPSTLVVLFSFPSLPCFTLPPFFLFEVPLLLLLWCRLHSPLRCVPHVDLSLSHIHVLACQRPREPVAVLSWSRLRLAFLLFFHLASRSCLRLSALLGALVCVREFVRP